MKLSDSIKQNINILDYAQRIGLTPVRQSDNRYTLLEHGSVVIRPKENVFIWNSEEKGGSIIDFAMTFKGMSQDDAYNELKGLLNNADFTISKAKRPPPAPKPTAPAEITFPPPFDGQFKRLYGYLCSGRGISPEIVTDLVRRDMLYEDDRHNCVFKGYDYDGAAKYGFKRATITGSSFRGEMSGTNEFNKQVGLYINNDAKSLFVSEAAIDNLSLMTLLHINGRDYNSYNYLALGGTYVDCLKYHMSQPQNNGIQRIYIATDNDAAGMKCRNEIRTWLTQAGFKGDIKDKIPLAKDWNDDLKRISSEQQAQHKPVERQASQDVERGIAR